jgi:hypothetical protein
VADLAPTGAAAKNSRPPLFRRRAAGLALLAGIAALSFLPAAWKRDVASTGVVHACEHVAAFCAAWLLWSYPPAERRKNAAVAGALFAFGCLLELVQKNVYAIRIEYADIVCDGLGIAAGFLAGLPASIRESVGHVPPDIDPGS